MHERTQNPTQPNRRSLHTAVETITEKGHSIETSN